MADIDIVLNRKGIADLLKAPGVLSDLERRAHAIAAQAGPGMEVDSEIGPHRARAAVITDTPQARHAESSGRALTRAIDAGR